MSKERYIDRLFDDNNFENIFLTDNEGKEIEFEQLGLVDYEGDYYAVLSPVTKIEGIGDDEVLIFMIDEENDALVYVEDDEVADGVLEVFNEMPEDEE